MQKQYSENNTTSEMYSFIVMNPYTGKQGWENEKTLLLQGFNDLKFSGIGLTG